MLNRIVPSGSKRNCSHRPCPPLFKHGVLGIPGAILAAMFASQAEAGQRSVFTLTE